jgi:hypothetical protein
VLDATVPGFRLTERFTQAMEGDLSEILKELPDDNTVVVFQVFDNSVYYDSREEGEKLVPQKGADKRNHVSGALRIVQGAIYQSSRVPEEDDCSVGASPEVPL